MKYAALLLSVCLAITGCASRSQISEDNPIKSISNLYNRNFIVAAPTYAGNIICGAPFFLIATAVANIHVTNKTETYTRFVNNIYFIPASICGTITGAIFIPVSYICKELPWDFDFKTTRNQSWNCE